MKKRVLAVAAIVLAGTASGASPSFRWTAGDLTTLPRLAETHQRIETTARNFCRDYLNGVRDINRTRTCVAAVMDEIVASIGDPRLTAYARTGTVDEALLASRN